MSDSLISALEKGTRTPRREHAEVLDTILSTGGTLTRLWLDINNSLDVPDWWRDIGLLERQAVEIKEYQPTLVPGLLQTDHYARTAMRSGRPWDTREAVEHDVRARVLRMSELQRSPLLWYVLDQYTLTRMVGSAAIMRTQLDELLHLIDEEAIKLQVIIQPAPHHPGMSGSFRILSFVDRSPVTLTEHLFGEEIIEATENVRRSSILFGALQGEALSLTESAKLVRESREEYA